MIHNGPATHVLFLDTDPAQFIMIGTLQELANISELLADDKSVIASIGSISADTWMLWKNESAFVYVDLLKNQAKPREYLQDICVVVDNGNEILTIGFLPEMNHDYYMSVVSDSLTLHGFASYRLKYSGSIFRPAYADDPNRYYNRVHQILIEYEPVQKQSDSTVKV